MDTDGQGTVVPLRRVAIHYVVLIAATVAVVAFVIATGAGKHAREAIAGGYEVSQGTTCLGPAVQLTQSGRFVSMGNAQSTISGLLNLNGTRLTGTISCLKGARAALDAKVSGGDLTGNLGGERVDAQLRDAPPAPGTPTPLAPGAVDGIYSIAPTSTCLGGTVTLAGGSDVKLTAGKTAHGTLHYAKGALSGDTTCLYGGQVSLVGNATGRTIDVMLTPLPGGPAASGPIVSRPVAEHLTATKQRTADQTVIAFFVAIVIVMLFARLVGSIMPRIGQPRVMGEVLAGILLGPTLFGVIDPSLQSQVFASDIVPYINVAANLGLIFYMFLIGLEVDLGLLRGRARMTLAVSNTALLVPLMLGLLIALPLFGTLAPNTRFLAFALFAGVSMSVTAFPVLARIISERRMLKRPLGALALSAAAVDDVSAWFLIALASAVAGAGSGLDVLRTIGWAVLFAVGMFVLVRPLLGRAAIAYDEVGHVPGLWITAIFAGVILSAVITDTIGIAVIFGAFVMGIVMPRHAGLSEDITRRVEDFVVTLLLPLFFAYTGLRTNIGLLNRPILILITLALCGVAIVGKYGGTLIASRVIQLPWRESAVLGALMNTRGLTELIVLNLALSMGVISSALFTALVIMALVTTLMAGPIMRLLDPHNSFGEAPETELAVARARQPVEERPERAILVAPQTTAALEQLLALARPLALAEPRHELILAQLVRPPRGSAVRAGLQTEARALSDASALLNHRREELIAQGISTRAAAITSADAGRDLLRLSRSDEVDLVLMDGRRPLLGGDGIPREEVGAVLADAPCDVAVLVARDGSAVSPGPGSLMMVPFGGADYDWAALELAASIAASTGAPLALLGASGTHADGRDASGLLANAALVVQQFAGVSVQTVIAEPGRAGLVKAASEAGLLLIGLSDRWQKEGLGETRRAIARSAPAPIVFVRRGERSGSIAPSGSMTRFGWSSAGWSRAT